MPADDKRRARARVVRARILAVAVVGAAALAGTIVTLAHPAQAAPKRHACGLPIPTTGYTSFAGSTSFVLDGTLDDNGLDTIWDFAYYQGGTQVGFSPSPSGTQTAGSGVLTHTAPVSGLTPDTDYTYRMRATNACGDAFGDIHSYHTSAQLTVTTTGAGTVTGTYGGGSPCPGNCTSSWLPGTVVHMHAVAAAGSVLTAWGGACSGTATTCDVTVTGDVHVTAAFGPAPATTTTTETTTESTTTAATTTAATTTAATTTVLTTTAPTTTTPPPAPARRPRKTVTVRRLGTHKGSVTGARRAIVCPSRCRAIFVVGSRITLTAQPLRGHHFVGWAGRCRGTRLTCTFVVRNHTTVTATFS